VAPDFFTRSLLRRRLEPARKPSVPPARPIEATTVGVPTGICVEAVCTSTRLPPNAPVADTDEIVAAESRNVSLRITWPVLVVVN